MSVHVSIHDVGPAFEREVDAALEACHRVGIVPGLLVVPNHHGRAPLAEAPHYAARLRQLQARGHEIFLHGFFHKAGLDDRGQPRPERARGLRRFFRQTVVSAGEAEFADVSRDEASARLEAGEAVLRGAGLRIDGFVAPAWSIPGWGRVLLGERGYRYTEDHTRIYDPARGTSRPSVVLNYASRTPGRLVSSALWARAARPLRRFVPARVALHPADMRFALLRREIEGLLAWAQGDTVTAAELLTA